MGTKTALAIPNITKKKIEIEKTYEKAGYKEKE